MTSDGYKALLVDLDGTLARASMNISARVAEAVTSLSQQLMVSIVSSRNFKSASEVSNRLGLSTLQISEGGARIFDPRTWKACWYCPLAPSDARRIMSFLEPNNLPFTAVDGDQTVKSTGEVALWSVSRVTAISLVPYQARQIADEFGKMAGKNTSIVVRVDNGEWMVDFTHSDVTKATAAARYAALNGITPLQIIAAGDSYNDLPLLQACGLRIAMGNAVPELKAVAHYVAPSVDEDGLAIAIEELVLPALKGQLPGVHL